MDPQLVGKKRKFIEDNLNLYEASVKLSPNVYITDADGNEHLASNVILNKYDFFRNMIDQYNGKIKLDYSGECVKAVLSYLYDNEEKIPIDNSKIAFEYIKMLHICIPEVDIIPYINQCLQKICNDTIDYILDPEEAINFVIFLIKTIRIVTKNTYTLECTGNIGRPADFIYNFVVNYSSTIQKMELPELKQIFHGTTIFCLPLIDNTIKNYCAKPIRIDLFRHNKTFLYRFQLELRKFYSKYEIISRIAAWNDVEFTRLTYKKGGCTWPSVKLLIDEWYGSEVVLNAENLKNIAFDKYEFQDANANKVICKKTKKKLWNISFNPYFGSLATTGWENMDFYISYDIIYKN